MPIKPTGVYNTKKTATKGAGAIISKMMDKYVKPAINSKAPMKTSAKAPVKAQVKAPVKYVQNDKTSAAIRAKEAANLAQLNAVANKGRVPDNQAKETKFLNYVANVDRSNTSRADLEAKRADLGLPSMSPQKLELATRKASTMSTQTGSDIGIQKAPSNMSSPKMEARTIGKPKPNRIRSIGRR
jgi:hypothetical protein